MLGIARLNDTIAGVFTSEHGGHYTKEGSPIHPSGTITGYIANNCSTKVFIKSLPVAIVGSITEETDACTNGQGTVSSGSPRIFIKGVPVARLTDEVTPHTTGSASITSASDKVKEG